jgi:outer membrane protein OmpA-like peptidoglycan-associated protein
LQGQTIVSLSTQNRKAKKYYQKAEYYIQRRELDGAILSLQNALRADSLFCEAQLLLGELYENTEQDSLALTHYEKLMQIDSSFYHPVYYFAGELAFAQEEYEKAKHYYQKYLQKNQSGLRNAKNAKRQLRHCQFAIEAIKHPVHFHPVNMGDSINSPEDEYFPTLTADSKTLLFTRTLQDKKAIKGKQEDFFVSSKEEGIWQKATPLGKPINTHFNEGAPSMSQDGNILFFTACETPYGYGDNRKGLGRCDIFYSTRNGSTWNMPQNLGAPVNSKYWDSQPSFSSDGKTLYFISNRNGGYDIFRTTIDSMHHWTPPEALSSNINTDGAESSVFIHPDNQTLYFASDTWPGMGGMDIFMSQKDSLGNWQRPVNLGYPINTVDDENSIIISADGKTAFFASDRKNGYGGLDIYQFELPQNIRPEAVSYLHGFVFDEDNKIALKAKVELIDRETAKTITTSLTNPKTGDFLISLLPNHNYVLNVRTKGYLFYSGQINVGSGTLLKPIQKDIPLKPIKIGAKIILRNVFFDTDQAKLQKESQIELRKVVELLQHNPGIHIEISGHTDNTGSESHNQDLSKRRAKTVFDYLCEQGIKASRMTYKGYGSRQAAGSNETEKDRAKNRRTEIKIIE